MMNVKTVLVFGLGCEGIQAKEVSEEIAKTISDTMNLEYTELDIHSNCLLQ